jgi:hypothetical protein
MRLMCLTRKPLDEDGSENPAAKPSLQKRNARVSLGAFVDDVSPANQ